MDHDEREPQRRTSRGGEGADASPDLASAIERVLPDGVPAAAAPEIADAIARIGVSVVQETAISHHGPLPAPDTLARYEDILPSSADRILVMAEGSLSHATRMERASSARATTGLWMGFVAFGALLAGAGYCASLQYTAGVMLFLGAAALGVIGRFLPRTVGTPRSE